MGKNLFTLIPKVDEVLDNEIIKELLETRPRKLVLDSIREEIDLLRNKIKIGELEENLILQEIKYLDKRIYHRIMKKKMYLV